MNQDLDAIARQPEQPMRLDHLEPFVHERRRVDRDLPPHLPGRMPERIVRRYRLEIAGGSAAEWSARCRQHDTAHLAQVAAVQALLDGVVLAVDRENHD